MLAITVVIAISYAYGRACLKDSGRENTVSYESFTAWMINEIKRLITLMGWNYAN